MKTFYAKSYKEQIKKFCELRFFFCANHSMQSCIAYQTNIDFLLYKVVQHIRL